MSAGHIFRFILSLVITFVDAASELGQGSLPFTCGDASVFGQAFNCHSPPNYPKDRRENENSLRIMQFNAESLFLEGCASWNIFDPERPEAKTNVGAMSHLQSVANTLYKLNADIIIVDEVCDCCVLRELIRHMNRNYVSQTYQEYLLPTQEANGEHIGIITRIDPIDIWNVQSLPMNLRSHVRAHHLHAIIPHDLPPPPPPPPQPLEYSRRRLMTMLNGRGVLKNKDKSDAQLYSPRYDTSKQKKHAHTQSMEANFERPSSLPKRQRISEDEGMAKPAGNFKHVALTFNVHLDKPVAIIAAQFADFAENNQRLRRAQAKDLATFVNLYQEQYHIVVVGDFNSVPESSVLKTFSDLTGFQNIGYKYYDHEDYTFIDHLSMGMLDNIFVSPPMFQKVQDTKIDYTRPKPVWPYSNHLPLIIDFDTTWYGGWASPKASPPQRKTVHPNEDRGDQYTVPSGNGLTFQHGGSGGGTQDYVADYHHLNGGGGGGGVNPRRRYANPMMSAMSPYVSAQVDDGDNDEYQYELDNDYYYDDEFGKDLQRFPDIVRVQNIGTDAIAKSGFSSHWTGDSNEMWYQSVIKWMMYLTAGITSLLIGAYAGYLLPDYWMHYKGSVIHIARF